MFHGILVSLSCEAHDAHSVCVVESADDVLCRVPMTLQFVASLKSYGNQQQIAWSSLQAIALMQQSTLLKLILWRRMYILDGYATTMEAYVHFGWVCKPHLHWLCMANSRGLHTSPNCTSIRCCWLVVGMADSDYNPRC
jgi:hypothetical protein